MSDKKYFHLLTDSEIDELVKLKKTWEDIRNEYQQPDWCSYPDALDFEMGCWSLTDIKNRSKICESFCKTCDCYKKHCK